MATPKSNIYTKTGDCGLTSLYNGRRVAKTDAVFEALGDIDELNACIGIALNFGVNELVDQLTEVQSRLLDIGSSIATPPGSTKEQLRRVAFDAVHTEVLEVMIDVLDNELPPLRNFILPGGGPMSSQLHLARTICRRAERHVLETKAEENVRIYLNRLSDYLFVAARYAAKVSGSEEVTYRKV